MQRPSTSNTSRHMTFIKSAGNNQASVPEHVPAWKSAPNVNGAKIPSQKYYSPICCNWKKTIEKKIPPDTREYKCVFPLPGNTITVLCYIESAFAYLFLYMTLNALQARIASEFCGLQLEKERKNTGKKGRF